MNPQSAKTKEVPINGSVPWYGRIILLWCTREGLFTTLFVVLFSLICWALYCWWVVKLDVESSNAATNKIMATAIEQMSHVVNDNTDQIKTNGKLIDVNKELNQQQVALLEENLAVNKQTNEEMVRAGNVMTAASQERTKQADTQIKLLGELIEEVKGSAKNPQTPPLATPRPINGGGV